MTDQPDRTPYCTKIRYGITGAPTIDGDEMDGSYAPGVGVQPVLIELVYSVARDGQPVHIDATVIGWWMRFGKRDQPEQRTATHFKDGPDGWPAWLAAEARLHDPAVPAPVLPSTDQVTPSRRAGLRDALRRAVCEAEGFAWDSDMLEPDEYGDHADAVLAVLYREWPWLRAEAEGAVLPAPVDRAAVLREAAAVVAADAEIHIRYGSATDYANRHAGLLRRLAAEARQPARCPHGCDTSRCSCLACDAEKADAEARGNDGQDDEAQRPDPIECGHEAALGQAQQEVRRLGLMVDEYGAGARTLGEKLREARTTNQRLNYRAQQMESELATYRRAVAQWEVSERGTYIPHSSLRAIGLAGGKDILGSIRHLKHFERVEQAEAAVERVRRLHDSLAGETELASPDDSITRGAAAKRIATALDGWNPAGLPSCDAQFVGGGRCAKPVGHRPPGSDDPHVPAAVVEAAAPADTQTATAEQPTMPEEKA